MRPCPTCHLPARLEEMGRSAREGSCTMRIAINGLGRVGRALLRQAVLSEDLEVVAVNDLADPHMLAALLRRDTTYGPFPVDVEAGDDFLLIAGQKVPWSDAKTPADLPWASYAVDVA